MNCFRIHDRLLRLVIHAKCTSFVDVMEDRIFNDEEEWKAAFHSRRHMQVVIPAMHIGNKGIDGTTKVGGVKFRYFN